MLGCEAYRHCIQSVYISGLFRSYFNTAGGLRQAAAVRYYRRIASLTFYKFPEFIESPAISKCLLSELSCLCEIIADDIAEIQHCPRKLYG